jgi:hypothetical protein
MSDNQPLGSLKQIPLREVWGNEAYDFTPWVADNIDKLAEALEMEIELVQREVDVGGFSLDLHARELSSNKEMIIENQLERTDHDHLGKLITYAAGKGASFIVWIASEFMEPHRQAIDWLNEITGPEVNFFGVKIELWQIDDYEVLAPRFNVVARPNEWQKAVRHTQEPASDRMQTYHDFFADLLEAVKQADPDLTSATRVFHQNWFGYPVGRTGFAIYVIFSWNPETNESGLLRIDLYIDTPDESRNKRAFETLLLQRNEIVSELGEEPEWDQMEEARASRISLYCPVYKDVTKTTEQERRTMLAWAVEHVLKFRSVFYHRVRNL